MPKESVEDEEEVQIDSSEESMHDVQHWLKKLQFMQFSTGFIISLFTFLNHADEYADLPSGGAFGRRPLL
ncbi:hypothetical protein AWB79_05276 [Caballeronia hypogeia]|uniref:Uncharacterized protein n=1 Tax=Caballeronia hypogeia TaxID=1777140 RepID=A0A158CGS9_9BURK|nr:hypothetical protein AWB79_05276 [Caballeronia hypogeia]